MLKNYPINCHELLNPYFSSNFKSYGIIMIEKITLLQQKIHRLCERSEYCGICEGGGCDDCAGGDIGVGCWARRVLL